MYKILSSKPHNPHYLKRYYTFIQACNQSAMTEYTEAHHVCPKASDLFPEYKSLKANPWNKINLTARQHFIAHWILWKAYGGSQAIAFWRMRKAKLVSGRVYEALKIAQAKVNSEKMKIITRQQVKAGTHNFQTTQYKELQSKRVSTKNKELSALGLHPTQQIEWKKKHSDRMRLYTYVTPKGQFTSLSLAAHAEGVTGATIFNRCVKQVDSPRKKGTWRSHGYYSIIL